MRPVTWVKWGREDGEAPREVWVETRWVGALLWCLVSMMECRAQG